MYFLQLFCTHGILQSSVNEIIRGCKEQLIRLDIRNNWTYEVSSNKISHFALQKEPDLPLRRAIGCNLATQVKSYDIWRITSLANRVASQFLNGDKVRFISPPQPMATICTTLNPLDAHRLLAHGQHLSSNHFCGWHISGYRSLVILPYNLMRITCKSEPTTVLRIRLMVTPSRQPSVIQTALLMGV